MGHDGNKQERRPVPNTDHVRQRGRLVREKERKVRKREMGEKEIH